VQRDFDWHRNDAVTRAEREAVASLATAAACCCVRRAPSPCCA
jgi:hypothetical protein